MDPQLAQGLSFLLTAIGTMILTVSVYYWGPEARARRYDKKDHHDEWEHEDDVREESRHNQDVERDFHRRHIRDDVQDDYADWHRKDDEDA